MISKNVKKEMKEPYFTTKTIENAAEKMVHHLNTMDRLTFYPEKSALIVLDMQDYFLNPSSHAFIPSASAIIKGILNLAHIGMDKNRPVILTRHLNTENNAGMLSTWWRDVIRETNDNSEIIPELKAIQAPILKKSQYDAFYQTDLEENLLSKNVTQVIVTGVMTHLCCETTARSAFVRGFQVFFPVDGTATYNSEHHEATLLNLSHGFAQICLISDLISKMEEIHAKA